MASSISGLEEADSTIPDAELGENALNKSETGGNQSKKRKFEEIDHPEINLDKFKVKPVILRESCIKDQLEVARLLERNCKEALEEYKDELGPNDDIESVKVELGRARIDRERCERQLAELKEILEDLAVWTDGYHTSNPVSTPKKLRKATKKVVQSEDQSGSPRTILDNWVNSSPRKVDTSENLYA